MPHRDHDLLRLVFAGLNDVEEWRLGDPAKAAAKGYPCAMAAPALDDHGVVFVDLTVDAASGDLVCHEVNGPNAAGSDALTGDSSLRARSEAAQTLQVLRERGYLDDRCRLREQVVSLHAHQHWPFFRTGAEFYPRVDRFATALEEALPPGSTCLRAARERPGDEALSVVVGDVPGVAAALTVDARSGGLAWHGRPVVFAGNPNLVPELWRTHKLPAGDWSRADLRVFHASRVLPIVHHKAWQQRLFSGTGVRPLRHFTATTVAEAVEQTRALLAGGPVVLKPTGTSGGTGVHVVVPGTTNSAITAAIGQVLADCRAKYGENSDAMVMPLTGVEFVRSTPCRRGGGEHVWDLRVAVLFEPGLARTFPVSIRIAPEPFDVDRFHLDRGQWISNASGRAGAWIESGMADDVLAAIGLSDSRMQHCMEACVAWTQRAWTAARGEGHALAATAGLPGVAEPKPA